MTLGHTIKRIRKMKNIKIRNICGEKIDKGNYWRFEQGKISVSAKTFYQIINNLNISFEEFSFYHNGFRADKADQWGKEMIQAFQSKKTNQLEKIAKKSKIEYIETQKIKYQHLHYLANIYLELVNKKSINPIWVSPLKEYLSGCEQWGYYEVSLFNNILFCFSDLNTVLVLYKRMNQSYLRSKPIHKTPNEETMLATNIISMCITEKAYHKAQEINRLIQSQVIGERSMFARTLLLWCEGIINKVVLKKESGLQQIETSLTIMKTLDMTSTFNMFERWTNQLLDNQSLGNEFLY